MVRNSFGKRNFMQLMGRPNNAFKVPIYFFLLSLRGGGRRGFFSFFHGSECVFTIFPSSSQYVPQHVLHSTLLLSHIRMLC
jgi:hypothetical protein